MPNFYMESSQKKIQEYIMNTINWDAIIKNKFIINRNEHVLHSHTIIIKSIHIW